MAAQPGQDEASAVRPRPRPAPAVQPRPPLRERVAVSLYGIMALFYFLLSILSYEFTVFRAFCCYFISAESSIITARCYQSSSSHLEAHHYLYKLRFAFSRMHRFIIIPAEFCLPFIVLSLSSARLFCSFHSQLILITPNAIS